MSNKLRNLIENTNFKEGHKQNQESIPYAMYRIIEQDITKVSTTVPEKSNKIYDYVDVLSELHNCSELKYIKTIHDMESEDQNSNGEFDDLSVYRVIAFDENNKKASIYDYEYHSDEEIILEWKSQLSYESSLEYIKKYGQDDFIIEAEDLLVSDFIISTQFNLK